MASSPLQLGQQLLPWCHYDSDAHYAAHHCNTQKLRRQKYLLKHTHLTAALDGAVGLTRKRSSLTCLESCARQLMMTLPPAKGPCIETDTAGAIAPIPQLSAFSTASL